MEANCPTAERAEIHRESHGGKQPPPPSIMDIYNLVALECPMYGKPHTCGVPTME